MRQLPNWLSAWMSYFRQTEVPDNYARWAGIWTIASALKDNVYFATGTKKVYPNVYVWLIGDGANGKGFSSGEGYRFLDSLAICNLYNGRLSASFMTGYLQQIARSNGKISSELSLFSDELAITVGEGLPAGEFLRLMTTLYDREYQNGTHAHQIMRTGRPCINWIASATIPWLQRSLPPDLIASGLVARVISVVEPLSMKIFPVIPPMDPQLENDLMVDLAFISSLSGAYTLSKSAEQIYSDWYFGQKTARLLIEDHIIRGIYGREHEAVMKVSMSLMASAGDSYEITDKAIVNAIKIVSHARQTSVPIYHDLAEKDKQRLSLRSRFEKPDPKKRRQEILDSTNEIIESLLGESLDIEEEITNEAKSKNIQVPKDTQVQNEFN